MGTRKSFTKDTALIQEQKRPYLICYLLGSDLGKYQILNPIPVHFFSPKPASSIVRTSASSAVLQIKQSLLNTKASLIKNGRSRKNCGNSMDLEN